jgi:PAS domain-containing protein
VAQQEIELILTKQLASYLATPIFLVDMAGTLLFYNDPAELILGRRYEETGEMPIDEWGTIFKPTDATGAPLATDELPLAIAVQHRRPAQGSFWITGLDGVARQISVTAIPLIGQGGRELGSLAIFWEMDRA